MVVLRVGDNLWDKKTALNWDDFFVVIAMVRDENNTLFLSGIGSDKLLQILASALNFVCIPSESIPPQNARKSSNVFSVALLGMGKDFWTLKFIHIDKVLEVSGNRHGICD